VQSVYTNVRDTDGLRRSTEVGRDMGFVGRSAIHPAQVAVINEVFTPTEREVHEANELLDRLDSEAASGAGAFALEDGRFVDRAVVESARVILALARRYSERAGAP
jgi:citrate lyase subunit beta/citryl-CoA lyase